MANDIETFRTTFAGVSRVEGDPHPRLYYRHTADRGDGVTKTLRGAAEVRDGATLLRIERELTAGDEIEITCETDWDSAGVSVTLVSFAKVSDSSGAKRPRP
jgi:hypothetical protein